MLQEMMTVVNQKEIAPDIFEMTLSGELVKEMTKPGQFIHIRIPRSDLLMRRPISLAEIDHSNHTCKIIYRTDGEGTTVLSQLKQNDLLDVLGPLGNGFEIEMVAPGDVVYVIGGGIGIPPLYQLGKELFAKGATIYFLNGFASKEVVYYEEEFKKLGELFIATDDGSCSIKGHVGNLMEEIVLQTKTPKAVFACGPSGLLRSVEERFDNHPHVYLSMEERMACGIGACYACVCPSKKDPAKNKKVCDEGPIFKSGEVII
ncbi:dihydroorotate dehydrogenase electron transfer subunit [Vagococcus jeotgali]|uniref:dihydroorotate dehydrogenase electron transfer subunit n=1 Tax=Vagococcus jeotgali TaxID=3109030 RepID=UPI002DDC6C8A|nr:dihydroorotate dehydrogenase electron transfer subunit [Vagococcus sp. B2T-5]